MIRITPLEPLEPYIAVADASFNTDIYSISFEFSAAKSAEETGTPSITNSGSLPADIELVPRILILALAPGRPVAAVTCTPAALPCNAWSTLFTGTFDN